MTALSFVYLIGGAAILMFAGDALVKGAIGISLRSGLSATFVSLTVVALGTSLPEMIVSVQAALQGSTDIALGNVIGSNVANILLILGVPALILAVKTSAAEQKRNALMMLAATGAFAAVAWTGEISRIAGIGFLLGLLFIISLSLYLSKNNPIEADDSDTNAANLSVQKLCGYLLIGVIGLPIGAQGLITGAKAIALSVGLSETAVGLTVIALGTSLPELAASVAAAMRGRTDVIMGNVIGSNLMNIMAIIGVTSIITPMAVTSTLVLTDITLLLGITSILTLVVIAKWPIGKGIGIAFLAGYGVFTWLAISHSAG